MPDDRALWKSLASRSFARAYCFHGEEDFLKDEAVRQLVATALDPATRDFNLDVRDAATLEAEALASLLATPPLMAERRVVVVRDASALRKDARVVVDRYLAQGGATTSSPPDVVLVLVYAAGGKPDRSVAERAYAVEMESLSGDRVPRWIAHHARTVLGADITAQAAALLFESAGSDLVTLAAELDKLVSYAGGVAIDEAAVTAIVGVRRGETLGDFLDLVARRDARGALALLTHVLEQPKVGAVPVVMALTTQTLALAWGHAMRQRGVTAARLEREYFDFLKSAGGAYTGRPWGEAVKAWAKVVDEWDDPVLEGTLEALLAADVALKETRLSSDEEILARLVLAICAADARPARSHAAVA